MLPEEDDDIIQEYPDTHPSNPIFRACEIVRRIEELMKEYNSIVWRNLRPSGFKLFPSADFLTGGGMRNHPSDAHNSCEHFIDSSRMKSIWIGAEHIRKRLKRYPEYFICAYCSKKGTPECGPDDRPWHIDHVYPKKHGGDNQPDNLVLSCATCNLSKNSKTAIEYIAHREANSAR